jgi:hypothetical protein
VGSWTGKYDVARIATDYVTKKTGVKPIAGWIHEKVSNAAHRAADSALNQQPEGTENARANRLAAEKEYAYSRGRQAEYDTAPNMRKAMRKRGLTIMGGS